MATFASQFNTLCKAEYLERLEKLMTDKQATVFSTTYCGYCTKAKKLLSTNQVEYNEIMLDEMQPDQAQEL